MKILLEPIGFVRNDFPRGQRPPTWQGTSSRIEIAPQWSAALSGLDGFSHVIVLCYLHLSSDEELTAMVRPRGRPEMPLVGFFGTRTPIRPNPISVTAVPLIERQGSTLYVRNLDVYDVAGLAGSGRTFVLDAMVCSSGDLMEEGILDALLVMPDGGAVAGRGWATEFYIAPGFAADVAWWDTVASGDHLRLGDAHVAFLAAQADAAVSDFHRAHIPVQMLFGDPALVTRPALAVDAAPLAAGLRGLEAAPNPFNPATVVAFDLDGDDPRPVRVEIFDLRGRRVATLMDGVLGPGAHAISWSPGAEVSAPDGVYFARVTAGGASDTVKLVRLD